MSNFLALDSMGKFSASTLTNCQPSNIFPGMIKIPYGDNQITLEQKSPLIQRKSVQQKKRTNNNLLPIAVAGISGFAIGSNIGRTERTVGNLQGGLVGAAVSMTAMIGAAGFYTAKYGGFFDKDRDYEAIFKNY